MCLGEWEITVRNGKRMGWKFLKILIIFPGSQQGYTRPMLEQFSVKNFTCVISFAFQNNSMKQYDSPYSRDGETEAENEWMAAPEFEPRLPDSQEYLKSLHRWLAEEPK